MEAQPVKIHGRLLVDRLVEGKREKTREDRRACFAEAGMQGADPAGAAMRMLPVLVREESARAEACLAGAVRESLLAGTVWCGAGNRSGRVRLARARVPEKAELHRASPWGWLDLCSPYRGPQGCHSHGRSTTCLWSSSGPELAQAGWRPGGVAAWTSLPMGFRHPHGRRREAVFALVWLDGLIHVAGHARAVDFRRAEQT